MPVKSVNTTTQTGDVLEQMIFPALKHGGYTWERHVLIGQRPGGGKHFVDAIVSKNGDRLLVSSKWQQVSGTAELKVAFEVICLVQALADNGYCKAYLVLGGSGWTLRNFYIGGGLNPFIVDGDKVLILALEDFVSKATQGAL